MYSSILLESRSLLRAKFSIAYNTSTGVPKYIKILKNYIHPIFKTYQNFALPLNFLQKADGAIMEVKMKILVYLSLLGLGKGVRRRHYSYIKPQKRSLVKHSSIERPFNFSCFITVWCTCYSPLQTVCRAGLVFD